MDKQIPNLKSTWKTKQASAIVWREVVMKDDMMVGNADWSKQWLTMLTQKMVNSDWAKWWSTMGYLNTIEGHKKIALKEWKQGFTRFDPIACIYKET